MAEVPTDHGRTGRWKSLEQWSPTLFLVAGGLMVILAMLWVAEVFMNMDMELVRNFFGPAGFVVAFVGLLGLYPALADRTPWLARSGAVFAVVGMVGAAVIAASVGSQLVGILEARPAWVNAFQLPLLVGIVLGFLTFGVASLRTDAYSAFVGLLLLGPAVMFPAVLVVIGVMGENFPYVLHVIHSIGEALVLLGVGYLLRTEGVPTDRAKPAPDTTTR